MAVESTTSLRIDVWAMATSLLGAAVGRLCGPGDPLEMLRFTCNESISTRF